MRPRFLIKIIEFAISNAINRGHAKVQMEDCRDAVVQHSNYLISDFGYEIRDVSGLDPDFLYAFIGVTNLLTASEVADLLLRFGLRSEAVDGAVRLMLWYGFLGVGDRNGREKFVYDYDYNERRLSVEVDALGENLLYVVNPAFHVALST